MNKDRSERLGLEPGACMDSDDTIQHSAFQSEIQLSIAISLKRIADVMEKTARIQLSPTWEQVP